MSTSQIELHRLELAASVWLSSIYMSPFPVLLCVPSLPLCIPSS